MLLESNTLVNFKKYIFVKAGSSTVKVFFDDIKYIEGLKDYVKIFTKTNSIITKCTIKHIADKLPEENFIRIHKSYIIAVDKIDKIEFNHTFISDKKIPIGLQFKTPFFNLIEKNRL